MDAIEKIRKEIERLKEEYNEQVSARLISESIVSMGKVEALNKVLAFIESMPDENNPEPYNPVYDEDYLNEKIAKATKSWEGVDVNKMLADCRGYEEKPSEGLEEAAKEYSESVSDGHNYRDLTCGFIAGAEWMESQFEHCGSFPVEDPRGGYWPTDYYVKKK